MSSAQIMVVENESVTAKYIEQCLARLGYGIPSVVHSAHAALEQAALCQPDLVLMDIGLQGDMDGIEGARLLRSRFGIPVTYLIAHTDDVALARAKKTAPDGYLVKPFDERQLHAMIQMALRCRHLERRVDEGQRWLATVLSAAGDGIIATDPDGRIRFVNRMAEALTGWSESEALGKELAQVFCTAPLEDPAANPHDSPARLEGRVEQVSLLPRAGKVRPIEMTAGTARGASGAIAGFVWAFHDITERRQAEEELRDKEAHFRSLIEQALDIILVVDRDATIYYASPAVDSVLGYGPADVLGRQALDVLHPEDRPRAVRTLARVFRDPARRARLETRVQHTDGSWRVMEVASRRLNTGGEDRIVITARDVTARHEADARLREETEVSAALARVGERVIAALGTRNLLDQLCAVTAEVVQCDFSHTWLYDENEGTYVAVAGAGDTAEQWASLHALRLPISIGDRLIERVGSEPVTELRVDQDQDILPAAIPERYGITAVLCTALRRGETLVGMHTAGYREPKRLFSKRQRKIAERIGRIASLALEHARVVQDLDTASRLKSDLMATLSHELRTPLASISGLNELFLEGEFGRTTEEQNNRLRAIGRIVHQMLELIEATLEFGRLERGRVRLDIRSVQPANLVREIMEECELLPRAAGVALHQEVAARLPEIRTDRVKLKVVLKNLLGNALKFTRAGAITLHVEAVDGGVLFTVRDTGPGIPAEARELIFEPFRQGADAGAAVRSGVGLGLYITTRLLEMLGGRIALDSEVGQGSVFRVQIPAKVPGYHDAVETAGKGGRTRACNTSK